MRAGTCLVAVGVCASLFLAGCARGGSSDGSSSDAAGPATRDHLAEFQPGTSPGSGASTPPCQVPAKFRGKDVGRLSVTDKLIALTFDAGANADGVPAIRRILRDKGVRATFFLTGRFVERYPVRSARIGHEYLLGNHSLAHRDLATLPDTAVRRQVREAERLILATTGQDPRRFFRFPYGARTAHAIDLLNGMCYVPFRWTVDTWGWKGTSGGMTARKVLNRVLAAASPGAIVLMHVGSNPDDGSTLDAHALPTVIDRLRARGYGFVRLSRVMSAAP